MAEGTWSRGLRHPTLRYGGAAGTSPEARIERNYRIVFALVLLALAVLLLGAAVSAGLAMMTSEPYIDSDQIARQVPLSAFAAVMAISWMPMFMPALVPIVGAIIAFWFAVVLLVAGGRTLVNYASRKATEATVHWRHMTPLSHRYTSK